MKFLYQDYNRFYYSPFTWRQHFSEIHRMFKGLKDKPQESREWAFLFLSLLLLSYLAGEAYDLINVSLYALLVLHFKVNVKHTELLSLPKHFVEILTKFSRK